MLAEICRNHLAERNNFLRRYHHLLLLFGKIEDPDVNEVLVRRGNLLNRRSHVDAVDTLVVRGRLLADKPAQPRQCQVPAAARYNRPKPSGRALPIRRERHVVLAKVPHEALDLVGNVPTIQIRERGADPFQGQRIHLESLRFVRVPVPTQVRAARGALDDGNGRRNVPGNLACKTQRV